MEEQASFHPQTKESIRANNLFIEWETPEYHHTPKNNNWYWVVGIITVTIGVVATLLGNFLLALIVMIGSFTLMMYAAKKPDNILIRVTPKGILVKDRLYPFSNIKSFCIKEHWRDYVLILDINKIMLPLTTIEIDSAVVDPNTLHQYLEAFIPEKQHDIPFIEILAERLGF